MCLTFCIHLFGELLIRLMGYSSSNLLNVIEEWRESQVGLTFHTQLWKIHWQDCCRCVWQFILDWAVSSLPCLFPSAESLTGRGQYVKRIRYHGKGMFGVMKIVRCHYFVKLVEGPPPPPEPPRTGFDQAKEYVQQLRSRTLINTLWQTFVTILLFLVWPCNYIKERLK